MQSSLNKHIVDPLRHLCHDSAIMLAGNARQAQQLYVIVFLSQPKSPASTVIGTICGARKLGGLRLEGHPA
jgi:hypothetical protein